MKENDRYLFFNEVIAEKFLKNKVLGFYINILHSTDSAFLSAEPGLL